MAERPEFRRYLVLIPANDCTTMTNLIGRVLGAVGKVPLGEVENRLLQTILNPKNIQGGEDEKLKQLQEIILKHQPTGLLVAPLAAITSSPLSLQPPQTSPLQPKQCEEILLLLPKNLQGRGRILLRCLMDKVDIDDRYAVTYRIDGKKFVYKNLPDLLRHFIDSSPFIRKKITLDENIRDSFSEFLSRIGVPQTILSHSGHSTVEEATKTEKKAHRKRKKPVSSTTTTTTSSTFPQWVDYF